MTHAVLTGPIKGTVTLADGTVVDVNPFVTYVNTAAQAAEVALLIGERYADEGHPGHEPDDKFDHDKKKSRANLAGLTEKG